MVKSLSFGSLIPDRHASSAAYRYGFQGQEKDDEIKGEGNSYNFTFRMHDPRVGRFFAKDPLFKKYPELTTYQFSNNNPIWMKEIEGLEGDPTSVMTSPVGNATVTSEYGDSRTCSQCSSTHAGTDFGVPIGTDVHSTASGTVIRSGISNSYGGVIIVNHGQVEGSTDHAYTLYAHLSQRNVNVGDNVTSDEVIAQSGNTGNSTGPHLHYEVIVANPNIQLTTAFFSDNLTRNRTELPELLNSNSDQVNTRNQINYKQLLQGFIEDRKSEIQDIINYNKKYGMEINEFEQSMIDEYNDEIKIYEERIKVYESEEKLMKNQGKINNIKL